MRIARDGETELGAPWSRGRSTCLIGGGIPGGWPAAAMRASARPGGEGDLAAGTRACSSKLVHGGLRYLAQLQVGVVRESVRGREALLRAAPGLVEELGFLMPVARGASLGRASLGRIMLEGGLTAYDLLARRRTHRRLRGGELELLAPRRGPRTGGRFRVRGCLTDDARLVCGSPSTRRGGRVPPHYGRSRGSSRHDGRPGVRVADRAPRAGQGGRGPCDGR